MKMSLKYNWLTRVHPSREDSNPEISVILHLGIFNLDIPKALKYSSLVFARWNLEPKTLSAHHGPLDICISACLTSSSRKNNSARKKQTFCDTYTLHLNLVPPPGNSPCWFVLVCHLCVLGFRLTSYISLMDPSCTPVRDFLNFFPNGEDISTSRD